MDSWVQLLRYSIPGALFCLLGYFYLFLFDSAVGSSNADEVGTLLKMPLLAVAGVILVGFLIYQLYYVLFEATNPYDASGKLLRNLLADENLPGAYKQAFGESIGDSRRSPADAVRHALAKRSDEPKLRGRIREELDDWRTADREWSEHEAAVSGISHVLLTNDLNDARQNFSGLRVIFHSLGACRLASCLALVGVVGYVSVSGEQSFICHFWKAVSAALESGTLTAVIFVACHRNRADARDVAYRRLEAAIKFSLTAKKLEADDSDKR